MVSILTVVSRFIFAVLITLYTCTAYIGYRERKGIKYNPFRVVAFLCVLLFGILGFSLIYLNTSDTRVIAIGAIYTCVLVAFYGIYRLVYGTKTHTLIMNMMMLCTLSILILYRLSEERANKQLLFLLGGLIILLTIPYIIRAVFKIKKISLYCGIMSALLLVIVLLLGKTSFGAVLSLDFGLFSIQPFEIVKVLYIIYVAGALRAKARFIDIIPVACITVFDMGLLALANDFGAVLIIMVVFLVMIFIASNNPVYIFIGAVCAAVGCPLAVKYISHIRIRFMAWMDPFSMIDDKGYQICQSLFAIVAGGMFGTGLYKGMPNKIPVVEKDFIFSAIVEEFGLIVGICIILIVINVFIILMDMAMKKNDGRLIFAGFGTLYIFQVLLTIGGAIKFIPSTGVTLPFVSYGGSSLLGTVLMLSVILALNIERKSKKIEGKK